MKLAARFLIPTLAGIFVALALYAFQAFRRHVTAMDADAERDHQVLARALGPAFVAAWIHDGPPEAEMLLRRVNTNESSLRSRWVEAAKAPVPFHKATGATDDLIVVRHNDGPDPELLTYAPLELPGHVGFIEIRESTAPRARYVTNTLVAATAAALVIFLWTASIVVGLGMLFIARPMRALVQHARRVGSGEFVAKTQWVHKDEIGELAGEMNRMSDLLAEARSRLASETSERLQALNELRHADRLATVGKLASGIAHELGTPLNVVQGRARMLLKPHALEAVGRNAQIIAQQAERMTQIIRQLLDFARAEGGDRRIVQTEALIARVVSLLEPVAGQKQIQLLFEETEARGVELLADASQLEQVLTNLILNGIQAMSSSGQIKVRLETRNELGQDGEGPVRPFAVIAVQDAGSGMPPHIAARVFEPFFTTKPVGEGTGLGLSVAYGIVRDHGGFLRLESNEGVGSTFFVYLPIRNPLSVEH